MRDSLPNGKDEIYIDNKLKLEAYYKNKKRENIWIEYKENGERRETPNSSGEFSSEIKDYYSNNRLKRITKFKNNEIRFRESYYSSGIIKKNITKIKDYDSLGKRIKKKIR